MGFQRIDFGFGNTLPADEVVAVLSPESAQSMIAHAQHQGIVKDATEGRLARAVIIIHSIRQFWSGGRHAQPFTSTADSQVAQIILSAIQPETVAQRFVFSQHSHSPSPNLHGLLTVMDIKLINIGFGNIVSANRVIAIVSPESAPIKRIISDARDRAQLVDATYGRRTRAVIITDSGHVILSAIQPETVANRFMSSRETAEE